MGRYDKIKVYKNGTEIQPNRVRVWQNGNWLDLGTNDSDNKRSLYVYKNGSRKRITLNKVVNVHNGYSYRHGGIQILEGNTCFSPITDVANEGDFEFTAYIRRVTSGTKNIFDAHGVYSPINHVYITLNANGTVTCNVNCGFGDNLKDSVATTDNAITDDGWHRIIMYAPKKANQYYVQLDDGTRKYASSKRAWQVYATNQLGDDGLHIRSDGFYFKTMNGGGSSTSTSDVIPNENDSYTTTTWE